MDVSEELRSEGRRKRFVLRRSLWWVSRDRRLLSCGRATISDFVGVHVVGDGDQARGTATGLASCGSIWSCPVCASHIRQARAVDIAAAAGQHLAAGGGVLFVTVTLRHHAGQRLVDTLDGLMQAWRATTRGAPWTRTRDRYGLLGVIRATEVTFGEANGWHPHLHLLLFLDRPLTAATSDQLHAWLRDRWAAVVQRRGLGTVSERHGVDLRPVTNGEGIGQYVAKVQERAVGLEMARGDLKRGRLERLMPFDILEAAGDGEAWAVDRWHEYESATKGRRCIEWSRGLRDRFQLGDELTDDELVQETEVGPDTLVTVVAAEDWALVCRYGLDVDLLDQAAALGKLGVDVVVRQARHLEQRRRSSG